MRLKQVLTVLLAVAVFLTVFTSCEGGGFVDRTKKDYEPETKLLSTTREEVTVEETAEVSTESETASPRNINVAGLRIVSARDTCPIKVKNTRMVKDYYTDKYINFSRDVIAFDVCNEGNETVNKVEIRYCLYDGSYNDVGDVITSPTNARMNRDLSYNISWDKTDAGYDTEVLSIAPGETKELVIRVVDPDGIYGVSAIVKSYETTSGKKYENPTEHDWWIECNGGNVPGTYNF